MHIGLLFSGGRFLPLSRSLQWRIIRNQKFTASITFDTQKALTKNRQNRVYRAFVSIFLIPHLFLLKNCWNWCEWTAPNKQKRKHNKTCCCYSRLMLPRIVVTNFNKPKQFAWVDDGDENAWIWVSAWFLISLVFMKFSLHKRFLSH